MKYLLSKLNIFTATKPVPDKQHKTDRLTPDFHQTQTPPDPIIDVNTASFAFLAVRVATVRTSFQFFRISQTTHLNSQVNRDRALPIKLRED
jgi:hypothetical protein